MANAPDPGVDAQGHPVIDPVSADPGWTLTTLNLYWTAIRNGDRDLAAERDRRYAEVSVEREKALKIKEVADLAALQLAREIQTYKDEKANELREQISSERGHYASKDDLGNVADKLEATIKPLAEFVASQQGRSGGRADMRAIYGLVLAALTIIIGIWLAKH